jgi:hypothetical protein
MKERPTHKKCRQCGEWFSFSKRAHLKQKFCSLGCSATYRNASPKWRKAQSRKIKAKTDPEIMRERAKALWRNPEIRDRLTEERRTRSNTKEHRAHMAEHNKKLWANAVFRKQHTERARKLAVKQWRDPAYREKMSAATSEMNKQRWADPEYKKKISFRIRVALHNPLTKKRQSKLSRERMQRPELRAQASQQMKERWQNADQRARMSEQSRKSARRKWRDDSGYRAKILASLRKVAQSPKHRAWLSELNKQRWADPEYRARREVLLTPERRAAISEQNKKRWSDPKYKARVGKKISQAKRRTQERL